MGKSIVVMGGSFNPLTIAHLKIIQKALESVNAQRGFLVPGNISSVILPCQKSFPRKHLQPAYSTD